MIKCQNVFKARADDVNLSAFRSTFCCNCIWLKNDVYNTSRVPVTRNKDCQLKKTNSYFWTFFFKHRATFRSEVLDLKNTFTCIRFTQTQN